MNTPVREIPYRTTLKTTDGEEFECVVFAKAANGNLSCRIDDERAGDEDGKVLVIELHQ